MFHMIVEKQVNLKDRTLILGIPNNDAIPSCITCGSRTFRVIGVSHGVSLPYVSLEIEKTYTKLEGKEIVENTKRAI